MTVLTVTYQHHCGSCAVQPHFNWKLGKLHQTGFLAHDLLLKPSGEIQRNAWEAACANTWVLRFVVHVWHSVTQPVSCMTRTSGIRYVSCWLTCRFVANQVTHPKLLQIHRQTVVCKTSGEPAEEDRQLKMDRCAGRQVQDTKSPVSIKQYGSFQFSSDP